MITVIFCLKRIAGITHQQFREHYERVHVVMTQKYIGHLMIGYKRNYVGEVRGSATFAGAPTPWEYDCITEWVLPSEAALEEIYRIFQDPDIGKEFYDDAPNFLDRDNGVEIICREVDVVDTGTGGAHGALERRAPADLWRSRQAARP